MSTELREEWRRNKRPNLVMELGDDCCTEHFNTAALERQPSAGGSNGGDRFLIMGVQRNGQLVPTLLLPWTKKSKVNKKNLHYFFNSFILIFSFFFLTQAIRNAVKSFKNFNCSDPKAVFNSDDETTSKPPIFFETGRQHWTRYSYCWNQCVFFFFVCPTIKRYHKNKNSLGLFLKQKNKVDEGNK